MYPASRFALQEGQFAQPGPPMGSSPLHPYPPLPFFIALPPASSLMQQISAPSSQHHPSGNQREHPKKPSIYTRCTSLEAQAEDHRREISHLKQEAAEFKEAMSRQQEEILNLTASLQKLSEMLNIPQFARADRLTALENALALYQLGHRITHTHPQGPFQSLSDVDQQQLPPFRQRPPNPNSLFQHQPFYQAT